MSAIQPRSLTGKSQKKPVITQQLFTKETWTIELLCYAQAGTGCWAVILRHANTLSFSLSKRPSAPFFPWRCQHRPWHPPPLKNRLSGHASIVCL